jgi:hypothetical protein
MVLTLLKKDSDFEFFKQVQLIIKQGRKPLYLTNFGTNLLLAKLQNQWPEKCCVRLHLALYDLILMIAQ